MDRRLGNNRLDSLRAFSGFLVRFIKSLDFRHDRQKGAGVVVDRRVHHLALIGDRSHALGNPLFAGRIELTSCPLRSKDTGLQKWVLRFLDLQTLSMEKFLGMDSYERKLHPI